MKKILVIIVVVLSFVAIGVGIIYVATHDFSVDKKNEDKKENVELNDGNIEVKKEDQVTLVETKEIDGAFVQKYEILINGLEKTLEIEFLYSDYNDIKAQALTGKLEGNTVYYYYESYKKGSKVDEDIYQDGHPYDENMIDSSFNENNFGFITGEDGKSYLLIHTNIYGDEAGEEDKLYILNDNLEFISNDLVDYAGSNETKGMTIMSTYSGYELEDDAYPWYTDTFKACESPSNCYIDVKIEDDRIYYLVPVLNEISEEETDEEEEEVKYYGELEERVYTINDSKLKYEVIKRYKIVGIVGQVE